jgi:hypothetical protein
MCCDQQSLVSISRLMTSFELIDRLGPFIKFIATLLEAFVETGFVKIMTTGSSVLL